MIRSILLLSPVNLRRSKLNRSERWRLPASAALPFYIYVSVSDGCVRGE